MSALKQLVPFVRLCQFFGLIPFTIVMDPETKEFLHFGFSLKTVPALWFFTLLAAQLFVVTLPVSTMLPNLINSDIVRELKLSTAALVLLVAYQLSLMLLFATKRVSVLRYKHLRRAVALVKEVEQHLSDLPKCKNRVVRRTIIGFLASVLLVGLFIYLSLPLLEIVLPRLVGPSTGISGTMIVLAIIQTYQMTMISCAFMMLHLSYYVIAHYIRLLKITFAGNEPFNSTGTDDKGDMTRLKKSQLIFNNLCLAAIELNHVFSFPALFIISSKLISILYGLFSFIHGIMYPTILMEKAFFMGPFSILMDSIMIYCYLNSADTLACQVRQLREKVISISNSKKETDVDYTIEVMSFMMMMDEDRIRLTGSRLFKVGVGIIPPFVASLVTYLIIMIQTQLNASSKIQR